MKLKVAVPLIVIALLCANLLQVNFLPVMGVGAEQEKTPGVSEGDWFKYDVTVSWDSDKPDAVPPLFAYSEDQRDWCYVEVISIEDSNITYERTYHLFNGEETTDLLWIDLLSISQQAFFIPSNLDEGAPVTALGYYFYINKTVTRNYGGFERETNYGRLHFPPPSTYADYIIPYPHNVSTKIDMYWDKEKGVLTEYYLFIGGEIEDGAYTYNVNYSLRIIDSNHTEIPEFSSWIILPLLMVATLTIIICKKKLYNNLN